MKNFNKSIFPPFFIIFFILAAVINSVGLVPHKLGVVIHNLSKFLMIMALGAIGLNTDLKEVKKFRPCAYASWIYYFCHSSGSFTRGGADGIGTDIRAAPTCDSRDGSPWRTIILL